MGVVLLPPANEVAGKSCFQAYWSVLLFMGWGVGVAGDHMSPLPMIHLTSLYNAPHPGLTLRHGTLIPQPLFSGKWHLVTISGNLFIFVHLRDPLGPLPPRYWHTEVGTVGKWWFVSYWNAFLFCVRREDKLCFSDDGHDLRIKWQIESRSVSLRIQKQVRKN